MAPMTRSKSPETIGQRKLVSTSGLFNEARGHSKVIPSRTILKPKARRRSSMTFHPPPKVSKASPLERFSKRHFDRVQRRSKRVHPVSRNLSGVLDKSRKRVLDSTTDSLKTAIESLNNKLSQIQLEAENSLKSSENLHDAVTKPFTEEQLQLTTTNAEGTQVIDRVPLIKRLQEHRQIMKAEAKELETLWDRWTKIRQEVTCLGVEVLGDKAFDLSNWADDAEFQKHLTNSIETFQSEQTITKEIESKEQQFEQGVKNFTADSIKAMLGTQEEWKREHGDLNDSLKAKTDALKRQMKSLPAPTNHDLNSPA